MTGTEVNRGVGSMMSRSSLRAPDIFAIFTAFDSESPESEATRNSATLSSGSMVAEIPILWTGLGITWSSRARLNARCVPLFVGTKECISSTIIHFKPASMGRNRLDASPSASDSGVVMRMWGGLRRIWSLSFWVVSPVLRPTLISLALFGR